MRVQRKHQGHLSLLEGEEILYTIGHHWLAGMTTLVIPVMILLITVGLYSYNALGGSFTFAYAGPTFALDLLDWLQIGLLMVIGALWQLLGMVEQKGSQGRRWSLVALALVVFSLLAFHATGGQWVTFDPAQAAPFHPFNLLLLAMALFTMVVISYRVLELLEQKLFLTTMRVIYVHGAILIPRLIERQAQQDLMLEDVQNVLSRTETYLQHWFNYGNITVQASNAGPPITFKAANQAKEMQRRIMNTRRTMLQAQSVHSYTTLIHTRVYGDKVAPPQQIHAYPVVTIPPFMRWLLHDNPRIDQAQGTLIWYPHWVVLIQTLLWPLGALVLVVGLLSTAAAFSLIGFGPLILIGLPTLIFCGFWIAYQIEDYRNDRYVLTTTTLIEINKRPYGPEKRRLAGLGTIQTVNYKTSFLSAILGYGDVVVQTAGQGGAFMFSNVPRPQDVAAKINQSISLYRKGERDRNLDEALSLLQQLHAFQLQRGEFKPPRASSASPPEAS